MSAQVEWALAHKADFVQLQTVTGIPALWAAAQHCHEGFNGDGTMTDLLANENNGGGLKWADWEAEYGCHPVQYKTWEWIDGQNQSVLADFCSAPDFRTWLKVYGHLLTLDCYKPALQYAADPFLYGAQVWAAGYATDPTYLAKRYPDGSVGGVVGWLFLLWPHFADTLPGRSPTPTQLQVALPDGTVISGELREDGTWTPLRRVVESVGGIVEWRGLNVEGPAVVLKKGCGCACCQ